MVYFSAMSDKKGRWKPTPTPNLVRYGPKGNYYLRARFGGSPVRECLYTKSYGIAKMKLNDRMADLRRMRPVRLTDIATLGDALTVVRASVANDPTLKPDSKATYFDWLDDLAPDMPAAVPETPLAKLRAGEMERWWSDAATRYAPSRANMLFMLIRRGLKVAIKAGALAKDPTEDLRRMVVPRTKWKMLTMEQFALLVCSVRGRSPQAADWIEFMTYCGLRPGAVEALLWEHLNEEVGVITVHGGKHAEPGSSRTIPMTPPMVDLVRRMRGDEHRVGKLFSINRPTTSLSRACDRLGLPHQRVYDLRHLFATRCTESGIDVPTFAGWLGHKDGGALAMRTYVHPTDEHGKRSAARVAF